MPSAEQVREALKVVRDPELMLDIINLGLIYEVNPKPDNTLDVDMTLTSPGCPAGPQIISEVYRVLRTSFPEVDDVKVNLVWIPFWNPDMMSEEAKEELGIF